MQYSKSPSCFPFLAMLLTSCMLASAIFVPTLELFGRNSSEFTFRLNHILPGILLGCLTVILLSLACQWLFRRHRLYSYCCAFFFSLASIIWLESFYHSYLANTFTTIHASYSLALLPSMLIELTLILPPVFIFFRFHRWLSRNATKIALIAILTQLAPLAHTYGTRRGGDYTHYNYTISEKNKFTLGYENNVLVIVIDCMGESLFKDTLHEFPELRDSLKDFTCFDRMVSPIPHTTFAVPAILTGIAFDERHRPELGNEHAEYINNACHAPGSLFSELGRVNYVREGYPYVLQTIAYSPELLDNVIDRQTHNHSWQVFANLWLATITPLVLQPLLNQPYLAWSERFIPPAEETMGRLFQNHDINNYHQLLLETKVGTAPNVFKYLHLQGAHVPIATDENLQPTFDTTTSRQLRGSFRIVEALLERLHMFGLYDRSMIVITGDHSENYTPEIATLIKRPGDVAAKINFNSVPCQLTDLAPTILASLHLRPAAESLFSRPPVASNGSRTLPPLRHWPTGAWHAQETAKLKPELIHPLAISFQMRDRTLHLTRIERNFQDPVAYRCRLYNLENNTILASEETLLQKPQKGEKYLISFPELDDGIYVLFLDERFDDQDAANSLIDENSDQENQSGGIFNVSSTPEPQLELYHTTCFQHYLLVSGQNITLHPRYPGLEPSPILPGQAITLLPMTRMPQIYFSPDCILTSQGLRVSNMSTLTILLPPGDRPMRLSLEVQLVSHNDLILQVLQKKQILATFQYSTLKAGSHPIEVPISATLRQEGRVELNFHYASRYRKQTLRQAALTQVKSITATER